MKKLYWFIIRSFMGPFAATFFISLFVLLMQFLWKYIDDLVGKGLEWYVLSELLFYASSTFVPLALPLAMLLSSIMTFGNLGEHSELTAIKAAGVSLQKAMRPLIATAFSISILAFLFSNYVLPLANLKMGTLLYDVRSQKPALNLKEGIFNSEIDGYVLYVGKKERDGETVRKVIIIDHTYHSGRLNITLAENGRINMSDDRRYMIFSLSDGYNYN
ncbi:MAG: LptF/LptG family permease [Bacteroidetes bacterium]|nr:LptF/LptG family permease [Bacteroidota bacterium]